MRKLVNLCGIMLLGAGLIAAADAPEQPKQETPAAKADLKNLQGTWRVVRAENKGEDVRQKLGYEQFTVEGNTMRMVRNGEERTTAFEIDPAHDPKWITFMPPTGKKIEGIYELKGDAWQTASSGRGRPATFEDKGAVMFVYERAKDAAATKPATKPAK